MFSLKKVEIIKLVLPKKVLVKDGFFKPGVWAMKNQTMGQVKLLSGLFLSLALAACKPSGFGSPVASDGTGGNNLNSSLPATPTPAPTPEPTPAVDSNTGTETEAMVLLDQGAPATFDDRLELSFNNDYMMKMKVSFDENCQGGTWEKFSKSKMITLDPSQKNKKVKISVMFIDMEYMETECFQSTIIHDDIAPQVVMDSTIPVLTNDAKQSVAFHAIDSGSGVNELYCILPGQLSATPCKGVFNANNLTDGKYVLQVMASDVAGNTSPTTSVAFTLDTTPPKVTLNSTPLAFSSSTSASFAFAGTDNLSGISKYECKLDGQKDSSVCESGLSLVDLAQGSHTLTVQAIDNAGNISKEEVYNWVVSSKAPSIQFTQTPPSRSSSASGNFVFVGREDDGTALVNFECRMDAGTFASCSSPKAFAALSEGKHSFGIRGISRTGIASSELTYTWTIDLTAPSISITKGPAAATNSNSANFTLSASDGQTGLSSVTCSLDGGAEKDCLSLAPSFTNLSGDAQHTFQVTVIDQAGNRAQTPPYVWYIDKSSPTIKIDSHPDSLTSQTTANFQISGSDDHGPVALQCKLDAAATFTPCSSAVTYSNVSDGNHIFYVQAADTAGNLSPIASYSWTVETVGPIITFTQTPKSIILTTDPAVVAYTVFDPVSAVTSVKCTIDTTVVACPNTSSATLTLPPMSVGSHTFTLVATNGAGLSSTRSYSFTSRELTCTTTLNSTKILTKMLFVLDMSGSNQSSTSCTLGPNCTDPRKTMRAGSIQQFFNDYGSRNNFAWGFETFQGSSATALINNGSPKTPIFSTASTMQNAINTFKGMTDSGATPYMASLQMATNMIAKDPDLNSAAQPQYIVVFMSDGQPNGTGDTTDNILNQVKAIVDLSPGRISFNTVYYGPVNAKASSLVQNMATTGNGNFLNTNTNPTGLVFQISDLVSVPVTTCE